MGVPWPGEWCPKMVPKNGAQKWCPKMVVPKEVPRGGAQNTVPKNPFVLCGRAEIWAPCFGHHLWRVFWAPPFLGTIFGHHFWTSGYHSPGQGTPMDSLASREPHTLYG